MQRLLISRREERKKGVTSFFLRGTFLIPFKMTAGFVCRMHNDSFTCRLGMLRCFHLWFRWLRRGGPRAVPQLRLLHPQRHGSRTQQPRRMLLTATMQWSSSQRGIGMGNAAETLVSARKGSCKTSQIRFDCCCEPIRCYNQASHAQCAASSSMSTADENCAAATEERRLNRRVLPFRKATAVGRTPLLNRSLRRCCMYQVGNTHTGRAHRGVRRLLLHT